MVRLTHKRAWLLKPVSLIMGLGLSLFLISLALASEKQPFVIVNDDREVFPFIMGHGKNIKPHLPGVSIEMLQLLEKHLPLSITFIRVPWKRALHMIQHGEADGVIASYRPERARMGFFPRKNGELDPSRRMSSNNYVLYTLKHAAIHWDPKQKKFLNLKGAIGAQLGYSIVNELKKNGVTVEEAHDPGSNLEKLLRGRIAALAEHEATIDALIRKYPEKYQQVQKCDSVLVPKPYYLMLSNQFYKTHPALAEQIWDVLAEIRKNQKAELMLKY